MNQHLKSKINIFWFRRDLRLNDNIGFYKALCGKYPVLPIFIFDSDILDELPKHDPRVSFIYNCLQKMRAALQKHDADLTIHFGNPLDIIKRLVFEYNIQNIITNCDYEPYSIKRDSEIKSLLTEKKVGFYSFKDHVIFEKNEIVKKDGTPYLVYTPYMKQWKAKFLSLGEIPCYDASILFTKLYKGSNFKAFSLEEIGFCASPIKVLDFDIGSSLIQQYENTRNFPNQESTSSLGPHLRFGTVSIREAVKKASESENETFLQELVWREYFIRLLWHFPKTTSEPYKANYRRIKWRNNEEEFNAWKIGKTGYPIVDAGMRQLNSTGYMHNRVRMVVASFLCKHLLIDWSWGEAYFA